MVEVPVPLSGSSSYTQLEMHTGDTTATGLARIAIVQNPGSSQVILAQGQQAPVAITTYDAGTMRWLGLFPLGGTQIVGEVSPNGIDWTALGVVSIANPTTIRVSIDAGVFDVFTASVGTASLDNFTVCPPP